MCRLMSQKPSFLRHSAGLRFRYCVLFILVLGIIVAMGKIKNQWSGASVDRILEVMRKCLVDHKAKQILFDYGDNGKINAIVFSLELSVECAVSRCIPIRECIEDLVRKTVFASDGQSKRAGLQNRMGKYTRLDYGSNGTH
jgi:hypothetical protein